MKCQADLAGSGFQHTWWSMFSPKCFKFFKAINSFVQHLIYYYLDGTISNCWFSKLKEKKKEQLKWSKQHHPTLELNHG